MSSKRLVFNLVVAVALLLGLVPLVQRAQAAPVELFFSEYIEGSSNNKALEIYNGTGAAITLGTSSYNIQMYFNGSVTPTLTINLTGTVPSGDVYVVAQSSASATILAQADQTNGSGWFNGDDAVVLRRGTTIIDVIGQIGVDPGTEWGTGLTSTADNTLRRKSNIEAGDINSADVFDPAVEWDGFATDTFDGLGSHTTTTTDVAPAVQNTTPANGATDVAVNANIDVTFSESVNVTGSWFTLTCSVSGAHTAAATGGSTTFTLNPDVDFANTENCTLTVFAAQVADQDANDPPDNMAADFVAGFTTVSAVDTAPTVSSVTPADGATNVAQNTNIVVAFSEPVDVAAGAITLACPTGTVVASNAANANVTSVTIDPVADLPANTVCQITVTASGVTDVDVNDPPNEMAADFTASFTAALPLCDQPFTPIYSIQGSGPITPIPGPVTTKGVVVGDYEGASPTLRGFYLQDASGDGNAATSDGIFVFNGNNNNVNLGDVVRVTGTAAEFQDQTQISATSIVNCGTGSVSPVDVTFPAPSATYLEQYEGMLVRLPQTLYVTEHFQLGRFGQVVMSSGGRLQQPTNIYPPGPIIAVQQATNNLNRIIVDDALQSQNPDPIVFGRGGQPLSASNTLRGGDTATGIIGLMTYTWAGNAASGNAYRVRPINALGSYINFDAANPRPTTAPNVGGSLKVAGMNLLNFFNTFDGLPDTVDNCNNGVGGAAADCRGADTQAEFDRQWPKTVAAILALNADVIGVNEIENDGYGPTSAIAFLVDRLNAATAPGTYAYIDVDTATGQVNALGADAIKVGMIYKTANVTPVGQTAALNTAAFVNGGDSAPRSRPSLAQAFQQNSNGARFIVDVNHLKSKGSACDAPDAGDGQGNCNLVRVNAATELLNWLAIDPTGTGDPDILLMGDYNSYAMEDPITVIKNAGFTNLISTFLGPDAYSYVFDGQWGYLDHALGSASITAQVTGVGDYHINSDEPSVLDYNTDFKTANLQTILYAPDQFRVSDHDPVIVGLQLNDPPTVDAGGPYSVNEGGSVAVSATGNDPNSDPLTYAWDLDNNGSFETSGQSVTFDATALDGPSSYTIRVRVTDNGGLSAVDEAAVHVLNAAPVINSVTNSGPINEGSSATITIVATDPAGANDPLSYEFDCNNDAVYETTIGSCAFADNGSYPVNVRVSDDDGGATTGSTTVTVNNVAPSVNTPVVSPEPSFKGFSVVASATFSDPGVNDAPFTCTVNYGDGSGNLPGTISGNTCTGPSHPYAAIGAYVVTVRVTDKDSGVGSNTAAHLVIFKFSGFFRPVDNPPALNIVKAGWIIPVRFSLNGYQGMNIFAAGYPKSRVMACSATAPEVNVDETISAGPSLLIYNPLTDRYIYIWKTEKSWAGTCRQLVVKLADGTPHYANFKFK